jgi:hypothetical protein
MGTACQNRLDKPDINLIGSESPDTGSRQVVAYFQQAVAAPVRRERWIDHLKGGIIPYLLYRRTMAGYYFPGMVLVGYPYLTIPDS